MVHCSKCGTKMYVTDTAVSPEENEVYRIRSCPKCGHRQITCELVLEDPDDIRWALEVLSRPRFHKNYADDQQITFEEIMKNG